MSDAVPARATSPFDELLGVTFDECGPDRVVAFVDVHEQLLQPFGIVHGGVYATIVESAASFGANAWLHASGRNADGWVTAGVSNATDFLRPVRTGRLRAEATPLQRGQTLQLWQVTVTDEQGRLAAHGKVKLVNYQPRG